MALAAALDTAWAWWRTRQDRLGDRDPSDLQDAPVAAAALRDDATETRMLAHRVRVEIVAALIRPEEEYDVHVAGLLLAAARLRSPLHRIHQRLLSLFPGVPDDVVEEARLLELDLGDLLDGTVVNPIQGAHIVIDQLDRLIAWIESEAGPIP